MAKGNYTTIEAKRRTADPPEKRSLVSKLLRFILRTFANFSMFGRILFFAQPDLHSDPALVPTPTRGPQWALVEVAAAPEPDQEVVQRQRLAPVLVLHRAKFTFTVTFLGVLFVSMRVINPKSLINAGSNVTVNLPFDPWTSTAPIDENRPPTRLHSESANPELSEISPICLSVSLLGANS